MTGDELAKDGAARAEKNANDKVFATIELGRPLRWSEMAMSALCKFIMTHTGKFQAEDVRNWAVNVPAAPSLRAWGAIMAKASRMGLIKHAGYERVNNPLAHATPASVWIAA
jgi:hypothetical protein